MAVIDTIPGLTVTVKVDDRTAHEYDDPHNEVARYPLERLFKYDLPPL
jgi:hypothetical protein